MLDQKRKRAPGGGRKPLAPGGLTSVSVTLSADDLEFLKGIDPNLSASIRKLIASSKPLPEER